MDSSSAAAAFNEFARALVGSVKYKPRASKGKNICGPNKEDVMFGKRCSPRGSAIRQDSDGNNERLQITATVWAELSRDT